MQTFDPILVSVPLPGFYLLKEALHQINCQRNCCVSVPLPGFSLLKVVQSPAAQSRNLVSVPLPGFYLLKGWHKLTRRALSCFSPVAGILFVERKARHNRDREPYSSCFSPVAGILFVERLRRLAASAVLDPGFSPVAGILFVESKSKGELAPFLIGVSPVAGILFGERPIAQTLSERGFCQRFSSTSF